MHSGRARSRTRGIVQQLAHLLPRNAALRGRADRASGARGQLAQLARRLSAGAGVGVRPPSSHGGLPAGCRGRNKARVKLG